jgi:phosphatidate cytidylyltransferase
MPATRGRGRGDAARGARPTARPAAAPPKSGRDMPTAIAVGLLLVAAFIGTLLVGPWAVMIVVVLIIGLAAVEFFDKVSEKGYRPATVAGVVAAAAFPLAAYWAGEQALPLVLLLAFTAGCLTFIAAPSLESSPLPNMAVTTLGVVWIGFTGAFAALILSFSNITLLNPAGSTTSVGTDTLFLLALGVVANDVGALFIGSAAGRTPLRQWISPNKTVEGFLGGAVMTLLAMVVVGVADKSSTWNSTGDLLILGAVISLTAPIGDLTESMFKRNLDIKDFGSLVKGHGGVLDRFDGFLFTLPAVYYLMQILEPWLTK